MAHARRHGLDQGPRQHGHSLRDFLVAGIWLDRHAALGDEVPAEIDQRAGERLAGNMDDGAADPPRVGQQDGRRPAPTGGLPRRLDDEAAGDQIRHDAGRARRAQAKQAAELAARVGLAGKDQGIGPGAVALVSEGETRLVDRDQTHPDRSDRGAVLERLRSKLIIAFGRNLREAPSQNIGKFLA